MRKRVFLASLCAACMIGASAFGADEPQSVIKYRQTVMKAVGAHMGAIASVVKGEVSFTDDVAAHASSMNAMSKLVTAIFPEGTDNGKFETRALPKIWEDWAGFEKAAMDFDAASANLAKVAAGGDMNAIRAAFGNLGKSCGGCHKPFRQPK